MRVVREALAEARGWAPSRRTQTRNRRLPISISVALLGWAFACAPAHQGAGEGVAIRFVTAMDGEDLTFIGEASFSVPRPVVVLDPLVFGDPDAHPPGYTVFEQVGPDRFRLKVSGTVYDPLADVVADGMADITEVMVTSGMFGRVATATVEPAAPPPKEPPVNPHPLSGWFAHVNGLEEAIRPFPYLGRFVSDVFTLPVGTGYNLIAVSVTSPTGHKATSAVEIRATVNREEMRYDLTAEISNQIDIGLFNPVLVMIDDPSVTEANVADARALLNGVEVGLRFVDGQLQLDRPLLGLDRVLARDAPNLVAVTGSPRGFVIEYRGVRAEFGWHYTGSG